MKIEHHLKRKERILKTISKLDYQEDYETLIEDYMLVSAHLINAAMHKIGTLKVDKDIKHNRIYGFLLKEKALTEKSEEVASLIQEIEQLRPSYVYGKGENGETAKKAEESFNKIKEVCENIITPNSNESSKEKVNEKGGSNEGEPKDSS